MRPFTIRSIDDLTAEFIVPLAKQRDRAVVHDVFSQIQRLAAPLVLDEGHARAFLSLMAALTLHAPWLRESYLQAVFLDGKKADHTLFAVNVVQADGSAKEFFRMLLHTPFRALCADLHRYEFGRHPGIGVSGSTHQEDVLMGYQLTFKKEQKPDAVSTPAPVPEELEVDDEPVIVATAKPHVDTLRPPPTALSAPPPSSPVHAIPQHASVEELSDEDILSIAPGRGSVPDEDDEDPFPLLQRITSSAEGSSRGTSYAPSE